MPDSERASVGDLGHMIRALTGRAVQFGLRSAGLTVGRAILTVDPNNGAGLLLIGMAYALRGQFDNAEEALIQLLRVDGKNFQGLLWLSRTALGTGRVADAKKWATEAASLYPESQLARAQLEQCNSATAELLPLELCEQIAATADRPVIARYGLGVALWAFKRGPDAIKMLERAIEDDPQYLPAIRELVQLYRKVEDPVGELKAARRAAEIARDTFAQTDLAFASISNGLMTEAEKCLESAIALGPHSAAEMMEIGFIHRVIGKTDAATRWFEASLESRPRQGESYFGSRPPSASQK